MKNQPNFFDFAARVGITKHIGGIDATQTLAGLCHIQADRYVLDVGCGVGATPTFLAQKYGCRVMGIDILECMVIRSKERAEKAGLSGRVGFRVADAQALPFEDNLFDAVMTESVTAFPPDKQKAVNEYARVTKPGGYVGLNESTWIKFPPPPELVAWASQDLGANVNPLAADGWVELLKTAGLKDLVVKSYEVNLEDESKGILRRYGFAGMLGILGRMMLLYARTPEYRQFVREVQRDGIHPKNLSEYFGYGLYVGKKYG